MTACACGAAAVVQWRRRPTEAELDRIVRAEETRRAAARALGAVLDEDTPAPGADATVPVYACASHALPPGIASQVHEAACAGPGKGGGACGCPLAEPEFPFDPAEEQRPAGLLPPGW
ncbi:hypothetical protein AB0469_31955 [Streptomyces sp. NPDC093801]|uniref:hypothetical protein n=1 Tax=Streptomyces sp. NPDC093801 TaxID=3155203 RepID=UPI00344E20EA